ncbi:polyphosphate:nucleotide phosphotransferase, PPK2 family [Rhodopirellula maiorica SM1]|uniref:Polyphosphate:nucleotide phosphotransferase, PPK2 family n=1 Tax=Rhodopirellula maiorica SM1 TaxID=1265738 RepID=M5RN35_9BACT|nr:polyphosphate kinase 2 family protein [Rhodopirellula maiorica]EMI15384.1 polyphosphate:nucleotide phosphotransferase, PPK2 family [Rhodopirellula maiorica SM1]
MDFVKKHIVEPGATVRLRKIATVPDGPFDDKQEAYDFTAETITKMRELQYRLYVEGKQSLLIVLQAPDAAGKDGVIRKVLGHLNAQGVRTFPFKVPTEIERSHDFLWRIHKCTPGAGQVSIFNRSHYEDVLAVRVEDLVPKSVWSKRYEMINNFELLLAENGTRIIKFYLHISPAEQLERFKERLDRPEKHWKLNLSDYDARQKWGKYREAYETVFEKCSSKAAPWFVIPADKKWYRNAAVSSIVCQTLKEMDPQLPKVEVDLDEVRERYETELAQLDDDS